MANLSSEDQAHYALCRRDLHQVLWLQETKNHPKLRVTYSTTTNFNDTSMPTVLFIGPMFGTRWNGVHFDKLARDGQIRMIFVDRPEFGGSTPTSLGTRMGVWLETVPVLLQRLNVDHVSIVTHSAGALYTLNTLLRYRSILDPVCPYVAFIAPWVPFTHSGATLPTIASKLPTSILDTWSGLAKFVNNGAIRSSGDIVSSLTSQVSQYLPPSAEASANSTSATLAEQYGFDEKTSKFVQDQAIKYQFAESTNGVNEELKFCLRKSSDIDWLEASDYPGCLKRIADNEDARAAQDPATPKLTIDASFAGSDTIIGKGGQDFFEQCWQGDQIKSKVNFRTTTFPEANHDSVLVDQKKGALKVILSRIAELHKGRTL